MEAAETILADFFSGVRIIDVDEHLDSTKRPHRLYVGDGFVHASATEKEQFVEIFSRFLAGHPEKNKRTQYREPLLPTLSSQFLYSKTRASISLKLKPWARLNTGKNNADARTKSVILPRIRTGLGVAAKTIN